MSHPEGFRPLTGLSPFNTLVGPLYERRDAAGVSLGYALLAEGEKLAGNFFTVHLAIDYASPARLGDWIESAVEIQQAGSRLAFANCYLVAGGRRIVRASAIFARAGKGE